MKENNEEQDNEIIDASEFDKITDNASLLKFCKEKNESEKEFTNEYMLYLMDHIKSQLFTKNIKLSIETCYELLIFCPRAGVYFMGYNHTLKSNGKTFLEQIDFGDNNNEKLNSLEQILNFIKSHKQSNENSDVQNYLRLIYFFLRFPIKTCSVNEFLEVMEFNFADSKIWDDGTIYLIIRILSSFIDKDKNQCSDVAKVLNDIFNSEFKHVKCDPGLINFIAKLLTKLKKLHMDISIDCTKIINNYFTQLPPEKFDFGTWLVLLSGCKDNSVSQVALDILIKSKQSLLGTVFLPFKYSLREDEISGIKTKYGKCIFTPSLINLIRHKFSFDKNYDLEKVLKDNFGENNFVKGDSCDLSVIMYRLCFECEQCIPHEKQDIIKLFESTKLFSPNTYCGDASYQYSQNIKEKIDVDLQCTSLTCYKNKIYAELDDFVQQIFIEKGVLPKDKDDNNKIILENQVNNNYNSKLTLEELKIMACSKFKIGDYDISKQKFETLIPDNIDNQYYFRWLLEFYRCTNYPKECRTGAPDEISKENFIFCVRRYKFTSPKDFNDFCYCIGKSGAYNKIKFDVDCVNVLLDAYNDCKHVGRIMLTNNESEVLGFNEDHITDYMKDVIRNVQSQFLVNRIKERFGIKLEIDNKAKQNCVTNQNQLLVNKIGQKLSSSVNSGYVADSLASKNTNWQRLGKRRKNDKSKTPLWLAIITFGAIFWVPWLFEKIFGCCCNIESDNMITDKNKNLRSSQNLIPDQSSSLEENLGKQKTNQNVKQKTIRK